MAVQRNTIQKDIVLKTVRNMHNHPTADAIYEEVKKEHKTISRATVFRILKQMAEQGLIYRVKIPEGADRFDFRTDEHYHIRCNCCGKVTDINVSDIGNLTEKINDTKGYSITGYNIAFNGICPECNKQN